MPVKKTAAKKNSGTKSKAVTKNKMETVMHEFKHGELKSGGRAKVKNPKQAIAIGLSEARRAGGKVPSKTAAKKTAIKKTVAKKAVKKAAPKKAAKKTATKKR